MALTSSVSLVRNTLLDQYFILVKCSV